MKKNKTVAVCMTIGIALVFASIAWIFFDYKGSLVLLPTWKSFIAMSTVLVSGIVLFVGSCVFPVELKYQVDKIEAKINRRGYLQNKKKKNQKV